MERHGAPPLSRSLNTRHTLERMLRGVLTGRARVRRGRGGAFWRFFGARVSGATTRGDAGSVAGRHLDGETALDMVVEAGSRVSNHFQER